MFHSVSEFLDIWKTESDLTLKVFRTLTDQSLSQRV